MTEGKEYLGQYEREAKKRRVAAEFQEIAASVIYDGIVTDEEIQMLQEWITKNSGDMGLKPVSDLTSLLQDIMADNVITLDERKRLFSFLESLTANEGVQAEFEKIFTSTPQIVFQGKVFMFTGEPKSGSREKLTAAIRQHGGVVDSSTEFTTRVDYLIVGDLGSEAMKMKLYGVKVDRALRLRKEGKSQVQILRERDFVEAILGS